MLELACLAVAGAFVGIGLSARKHRAPRWIAVLALALAGLALLTAVVLLVTTAHP